MSDGVPGTTFGAVAESYARTRPPYLRAAIEWVADRLDLTPDSSVLDLGAGTGNLTRMLRELFAHVVAVEPVKRMRALDPAIVAGSAEEIPLPDAAVDAIFAGEAFHWFDHARALEECTRVGRGLAILMRSWGETEQPGLLPAATWAELDSLWARFHGDKTRDEFYDWREAVPPDGSKTFTETTRISGRDLVDLHLIAERAYPLMDDEYDLRVVTYAYWKRLR